jgi:hypothetical protein
LQIRVSVSSKGSASIKSGNLAVVIFQIFVSYKSAQIFGSKSFGSNLLRVSKSASRFLGQVLVSKRFHLAKSIFHGLRFSWQSQVSKIGFKIFSKNFGKFISGFFARFIFSGKVTYSQSQFLAKVLASSWLWCFGKSVLISKAKSGL